MKPFFIVCLSFLLTSCLSEKGVNPGKASTFIRYYSGGYNDNAVAFEETPDKGFIILGTVVNVISADQPSQYRIKLIKTDEFGNPLWQKIYPDFSNKALNYRARGLQILQNGGYVITGENIKIDSLTNIPYSNTLLMTLDGSGTVVKIKSIKQPALKSVAGQAVAINSTGNFLVLSTASPNMILSEVKKDDLTPVWANSYAAGQTTLTNRMYLDDAGKVFWAGKVTKGGVDGIRFVKTGQNSQNTDFDLELLNPGFSEEATDFCRFGFGFAVIGSTNKKKGRDDPADRDILFKRLGQDGAVLSTQSFPIVSPEAIKAGGTALDDKQDDKGNSISSTQDGGLILLGSANSTALKSIDPNHVGGDFDFLLIKINAFGDEDWRASFGSRFKDQGVAIRQASDGGYVVLGTTTQGGQDIMVLTKTNKVGKIE